MSQWAEILPIHSRDGLSKLPLNLLFLFQDVDMGVDAASLLKGGNPTPHPGSTPRKLIVRSKDWPIQCVLQGYQSKNSPNRLAVEKGVGLW